MAMYTYGVESKGMAITINELQVLCSLNKSTIKADFIRDIDNLDFDEIVDFIYSVEFATFIGEFEGYLETDKMQDRTYFNGDDIALFELKKNTLYDKYENREEIIAELKETLNAVGIKVDDEYIEAHFGYLNGSYYA